MNKSTLRAALLTVVTVACHPGAAGRPSPATNAEEAHTTATKIGVALVALGYQGDATPPGRAPSLETDMVWEGGLRFTQVPPDTYLTYYLRREARCPDSLSALMAGCILRDVILVAPPQRTAPHSTILTLVARTVVGPRQGPIRPWPTSDRARTDAATVAHRFGVRTVVAESLEVAP